MCLGHGRGKKLKSNVILQGSCLDTLKKLPDESINLCVTSPPYYGLRDYGTGTWVGGDPKCKHYRANHANKGSFHEKIFKTGVGVSDSIQKKVCKYCGAVRVDNQIGLEDTPQEYISKLVDVFREVRRVLTDDGLLFVNIGDTYAGSGGRGTRQTLAKNKSHTDNIDVANLGKLSTPIHVPSCKNKDMIGVPWMLAFALRDDGWYLRQDIIWHKPNPMPESVLDRFTKSHEYIFMLSKSANYYFDHESIQESVENGKRNKRDVWSVSPSQFKQAHFATFPKELIEPCIIAGCPKGGVVLDPFLGSGTVAVVAKENQRNWIGCELNPEYAEMARVRIKNTQRKLLVR